MTKLEQYYNKFHEEHRLETRHGFVEFNTSMKFIHEAINSPSAKILDIGAGTGRYSVALSREGYDVTAVELVKHNLEILRAKHENVKTWQGDARDLHFRRKDRLLPLLGLREGSRGAARNPCDRTQLG